jgi:hypothetical protein
MRIDVRSYASRRTFSRMRRRQLPVRLDLRLEIGDLLFGGGNGIGAGDKAARRSFLVRNRDERACELRRVRLARRHAGLIRQRRRAERPGTTARCQIAS